MNMNNKNKDLVQQIRNQYIQNKPSKLEALKRLDNQVKVPVYIVTYGYGILSFLIMGSGMSLMMTNLGEILHLANSNKIGLILGITGLIMSFFIYPIYSFYLQYRKNQYAQQILSLLDEIR